MVWDIPRWNNNGVEPPEQKKTDGWLQGDKPPADWFNWFFSGVYQSLSQSKTDIESNDLDINNIQVELANYNFDVTATDLDDKPIQTQYTRQDTTLYLQVDASNPDTNGYYQTVIETYYDLDGVTLLKTVTWTLTYNVDGLVISRSWVVT